MKSVIGFLSRPHGYNALTGLLNSKEYSLKMVFTHSLNPISQDPNRSKRSDFDLFLKTCTNNDIPIIAVDSKEQLIEVPNCDFIVEISWRYLIPENITRKARKGAFGIHRGKLPDFAGAEPIKQALLKDEKEIILTAHYLDSRIDQGQVIATLSHSVNYDQKFSLDENIQRLRDEITPLISPLMFKAFKILENKYHIS